MYLYYWPSEYGIIIVIVAVVMGLVFLLRRAPNVLLGVFAIILFPVYLILSIIKKCKTENGKK